MGDNDDAVAPGTSRQRGNGASGEGNQLGRRNRMRQYLNGKQKELEATRLAVRMAGELLTNHLKLVVAGSPGAVARKRALARGLAREFDRSCREARQCYRELCAAQADLEAARDTDHEQEALARRDAEEERFLNAFAAVIALPLGEPANRSGIDEMPHRPGGRPHVGTD